MKIEKNKKLIYLVLLFLSYSISVLLSKVASLQNELLIFLVYYGCSLLFLGIYAIGWQYILKSINLSIAYPLKSMTLIFGFFFGVILFKETLTMGMMVGLITILFGIFLLGNQHE